MTEANALKYYETLYKADDYHEQDGHVLWWRLPVQEPPYCGTPMDSEWIEDYYTHWTRIIRNERIEEWHRWNEKDEDFDRVATDASLVG